MTVPPPQYALRMFFVGLAVCALAATAGAQQSDVTALRDRMDAASYRAMLALVDSARGAGLPTAPLISKAQEGLLKRAAPSAIVAASQGLLTRLRVAREALGLAALPAELEAGASALRAGAVARNLVDLRANRTGQGVTVPLVVFADLLARGVPKDTAARALQAMAAANATDAAFNALRLSIERDISGGMSPATAAGMRYRAMLGRQP
jgi:hypothetical protein